jgi:hypothetical protein
MGGLLVKHFGLLVAVLAAFPSLCCGQFTLDTGEQPGKVTCCRSESPSPADHPFQPSKPVDECCCQADVTLPSNSVRIPHSGFAFSLRLMVAAELRPALPTTPPTAGCLFDSSPPLHVLQCVWLN